MWWRNWREKQDKSFNTIVNKNCIFILNIRIVLAIIADQLLHFGSGNFSVKYVSSSKFLTLMVELNPWFWVMSVIVLMAFSRFPIRPGLTLA